MQVIADDPDTNRLLEVVALILVRVFGHPAEARETVRSFYTHNSPHFDDDFYHHEGPFQCAAIIHYASTRAEWTFQGFHEWLHGQDLRRERAEALAYFREHYFDEP